MQEHIIILDCDEDMAALKEIFDVTEPHLEFRHIVHRMLAEIVNDCYVKSLASRDVAISTNFYISQLGSIPDCPYSAYICHASGGVEIPDQFKNKRSARDIIKSLAENIRTQLKTFNYYDANGILTVELSPEIPWESLDIRLRRIR